MKTKAELDKLTDDAIVYLGRQRRTRDRAVRAQLRMARDLAGLLRTQFPDDAALARAYGTSSPGRIRRLLDHLEKSGLIVVKMDYSGRRAIGIPDLGVSTAAV